MNQRLFSIPYDTSINPIDYINAINPYKQSIENLYFGAPSLGNNYHTRYLHDADYNYENVLHENDNFKQFLDITKGKYKRTLTFNNVHLNTMGMDKRVFAETNVIPILEKYQIEGIIITDFAMATHIHKIMPKLEICTSCNSFIWTKREMNYWTEEAGATIFNPPRDTIRMPRMLEYFRSTGYKIKYIVNESCVFGCPYRIEHAIDVSVGIKNNNRNCHHNDISNFLRSTFVLPRWLPKLDKFTDIYKISGRMSNLNFIKKTLDAYINLRDDIDIKEIVLGGIYREQIKDISIKSKDIPDKLLTCECKDCNRTCFLCKDLMLKFMEKSKKK